MKNRKPIIFAILTVIAFVAIYFAVKADLDLKYLMLLQNFRNGINDALTPFMDELSHFAVNYLIAIPILIYWCIDKRNGLYTLACWSLSIAVNAAIKLTACVYRPWIRSSEIVPFGNSIIEATGYSFPSGHVMYATPIYGTTAVNYGKKYKWIGAVCIILILLTGFSRNYLGVHTPQDVLVGLIVSLWIIYLISRLFDYLKDHPEMEDRFLLAGILFGIAILIYITFKPYPMDYVNGKLLVDPKNMLVDAYADTASLIVFCAARYIEKRWIRFEPTGLNAKGIVIAIVGGGICWLINQLKEPLKTALGAAYGKMALGIIMLLFALVLWPIVIKLVCNKKEETEETE